MTFDEKWDDITDLSGLQYKPVISLYVNDLSNALAERCNQADLLNEMERETGDIIFEVIRWLVNFSTLGYYNRTGYYSLSPYAEISLYGNENFDLFYDPDIFTDELGTLALDSDPESLEFEDYSSISFSGFTRASKAKFLASMGWDELPASEYSYTTFMPVPQRGGLYIYFKEFLRYLRHPGYFEYGPYQPCLISKSLSFVDCGKYYCSTVVEQSYSRWYQDGSWHYSHRIRIWVNDVLVSDVTDESSWIDTKSLLTFEWQYQSDARYFMCHTRASAYQQIGDESLFENSYRSERIEVYANITVGSLRSHSYTRNQRATTPSLHRNRVWSVVNYNDPEHNIPNLPYLTPVTKNGFQKLIDETVEGDVEYTLEELGLSGDKDEIVAAAVDAIDIPVDGEIGMASTCYLAANIINNGITTTDRAYPNTYYNPTAIQMINPYFEYV